jgi:ABC-type transport system involved in cytochrome bd biosynthesis fused ATPase/permease subunit
MTLLRRPLYQRTEGADDDRWRLAFDTEARRLYVEHESERGDMRGSGFGIEIEEIDVAVFLGESGQGQHELVQLLSSLFEARKDAARP